jgi:hypothetical protein
MQENIRHQNLAAGRWGELSFYEQMGNIGSEVGRAIAWQKKQDTIHREKALERMFELIDLTIRDERWRRSFPRLKELLRAREVLADYFYGDNIYCSLPEQLERYFYYFAFVARRGR